MVARSNSIELGEVDAWLADLVPRRGQDAVTNIREAINEAQRIHGVEEIHGQQRMLYLLQTAVILDGLQLDTSSLIASLLAETPDSNKFDADRMIEAFGKPVLTMIGEVNKIARLTVSRQENTDKKQQENLRRMLLDLADDVRIVMIVLARRLQKLRMLKTYPPAEQQDVAHETLQIHAPLANRLGIWQLKWELEDRAFFYTNRDTYLELAADLEAKRQEREDYIGGFIDTLEVMCRDQSIDAKISGRPKHIYSIWKKMQRKNVDFTQIYDIRAVRVQVKSIADCYQVLGMVHGKWRPIPGEFDDYIARPKQNGYSSLHTAVIGDDGISIEVQVRTAEMDEHAERGIAAHWRYKENRGQDQNLEQRIAWMRSWLEEKNPGSEPDAEFEAKTIYVLTPQGKVIELPMGATAVDFAYAIHSAVGHHCRGAKVDGHIIPLTRALVSGQTVEVLTVKEGGPSRDWLTSGSRYVTTSRARGHIRQWFKRQDYDQHVQMGRAALDREINRLGMGKIILDDIVERFDFRSADDLLAAIGRGDISPLQVANTRLPTVRRDADVEIPERIKKKSKSRQAKRGAQIVVQGVGDLMTQIAGCCKPVPYDPIIGYITRGRGITVHRKNCTMVARMDDEQQQRLIPVDWADKQPDSVFLVDIQIYADDRKDLLRDVTSVFSNEEIALLGVNTQTDRQREKANMLISVEIKDMNQLSRILDKLSQVPDVYSVRRQA